jgi:serine/threonine protein kinase
MPILERPPERELASGSRIAGRYVVIKKIGRGGQGDVFLVEEEPSSELRAIKITRMQIPAFTARALRGAALLQRVQHPHVVRVTDAGQMPDGCAYIVSAWIDGLSLSEYFKGRPPSVEEICVVGELISDALQSVHAAGGVHRDVKSDNVLVPFIDGAPDLSSLVLVDFGLSQPLKQSEIRGPSTAFGWISGTVSHMAPEQLAGRRSSPQTDLYGLGATLYELAYGRSLACDTSWGRASIDQPAFPTVYIGPLVMQRLTQEITLPASDRVPEQLQLLLARLLRRRPNERFESALVVANEFRHLRDLLCGESKLCSVD